MALGAGSVSHPEDVECCPTFKCLYPGKLLSCFKIVDRSIPRSIHPASHPSIHSINSIHTCIHAATHASMRTYIHTTYLLLHTSFLPSIDSCMRPCIHPSCTNASILPEASMYPCLLHVFFPSSFTSNFGVTKTCRIGGI